MRSRELNIEPIPKLYRGRGELHFALKTSRDWARARWFWHRLIVLLGLLIVASSSRAQTPGSLYTWSDNTPETWQAWGYETLGPFYPTESWNTAALSASGGNLIVTENATGSGGTVVGGKEWIFDDFNRSRENWNSVKGNTDLTGLETVQIDIQHNSPTATVNVNFFLVAYQNNQATTVTSGPSWPIGPGLNTITFPLNLLSTQLQGNIKNIMIVPDVHTSVGNLTWKLSNVRSTGTPLAYRDIVTNNAGTPDEGLDGAFPLNTSDMAAISGNTGSVSQLGLSRNPAGTGSLQWTDLGDHGNSNNVSGASIGWGNGAGWRNAIPGSPTSGNSYNERVSDFSNYDRMTVRISAQDNVNPSGTVGIDGVFLESAANSIGTTLPTQYLTTDGQYHDLVYDLSSVSFLQTIENWGLDVAAHPNDIVFNIDNIRLWNSAVPAGVPGDYNGNGVVDAGDYVQWRKGGVLQNEGVTPGSNTAEDYTFWRSRYGATSGSGSGLGRSTIPEPSSAMLFVAAMLVWMGNHRGGKSKVSPSSRYPVRSIAMPAGIYSDGREEK